MQLGRQTCHLYVEAQHGDKSIFEGVDNVFTAKVEHEKFPCHLWGVDTVRREKLLVRYTYELHYTHKLHANTTCFI